MALGKLLHNKTLFVIVCFLNKMFFLLIQETTGLVVRIGKKKVCGCGITPENL